MLFGPRAVPMAGEALSALLHGLSDPVLLPLLWRAIFLPQPMPERFAEHIPFDLAGRAGQITLEGEDAAALGPGLFESALRSRNCRVPVSFLGGSADAVINNRIHGALAARLIRDATFEMLPGIGPMLHHACAEQVVATAWISRVFKRPRDGFHTAADGGASHHHSR